MFADVGPLRVKPYRRLLAASAVTALGGQLTAVAVPLQVYEITGSSAYIGLAALLALTPMVAGALWGGAIADVVDRRRMLLVTSGGIALVSVLLCAQAFAGLRSAVLLMALIAVQQGMYGANAAVSGAVVPRLVPAELLTAANALQSSAFLIGAVAGPLAAGLLLSVTDIETLYLIDAVALCATLWAVWRLPPLPPLDGGGAPRRAGPRQILEGFRYLVGRRILLVAYLADFIALFFGMPSALFPQLARETFGDPPGGGTALGVLNASLAAGALLTGLLSGTFTRTRRHGVMVTVSVCVWGAAIAAFGLTRELWAASLTLAVAGAGLVLLGVFRKTILQAAAKDAMRGRLQGADIVVAAGGPRLADFAHGTAGAAAGTTWTITGGGLLAVVVMLLTAAAFPVLWRYRAGRPATEEVTDPPRRPADPPGPDRDRCP
ncbi:MFS transporter [Spongiactinospora rosea]|uniref:MFS transporter n=1 Tax=Spongiactinospora rosea TaxID=2248750 RepID=A0A366LMS2_9ACTN|nr:MFS transporter [Spongiactinospora rosea]